MNAPPAAESRPVIRVVHPSGSLAEHTGALERGLAALESAGCEVRWDKTRAATSWRGYFAGQDQDRAQELCEALSEPGVDIVWAARGGSGANRIIEPVLDYARNISPRILIGFSDITTLLNGFALHLGWITFHGPVVTTLGRTSPETDLNSILAALQGDSVDVKFPIQQGHADKLVGRLLGGNLTVLASMTGSILTAGCGRDAIWLVEDIGESPYRLDRCLWQLKQSGALKDSAGLWMGNMDLDRGEADRFAENAVHDTAISLTRGAPAGHKGCLGILPIGARIMLEPSVGKMTSLEPWVDRNDA